MTSLHDAVFEFCFHRCPWLLDDPETFEQLVRFIYRVVLSANNSGRAEAFSLITTIKEN